MKLKQMRRGITLIEVLITSALIGILIILIVYALLSGMQSSDYTINRSVDTNDVTLTINEISKNILLASSAPNNLLYSGTEFLADTDTLILQIPAIDNTGSVKDGFFDSIVYDYNTLEKKLKVLLLPDVQSAREFTQRDLVKNVELFTFEQAMSSRGLIITVNATITSSSYSKVTDYSLSRATRLRNQNY